MVSPYFWKNDDLYFFLVIYRTSGKWWPFLAVVSAPLPYSRVIYPVFFLNSATKKNKFYSDVTPGWCHQGRQLMVSPYFSFFLEKTDDFFLSFLVIAFRKVMTFLAVVYPHHSHFPRRLSSVLSKFSHKKINFIRVSPPGWSTTQWRHWLGSRTWAFDWYQTRWPWMTLNGVIALTAE